GGGRCMFEGGVGGGGVAVRGASRPWIGAEAKLSEPRTPVQLFGLSAPGRAPVARLGRCSLCRGGGLRPRPPSLFTLVAHELGSERALCGVLVMSSTLQGDPLRRRLTPESHRIEVIEFQQPACRATLTLGADKRASTSISLPYRAPDLGRDVPVVRQRAPLAGAGLAGCRELPPFVL